MNTSPPATPETARSGGGAQLAVVVAVILVVWLVALPALDRQPAIRSYGDHLERRNVDASAMFYTELPNLDRALLPVQSLQRRQPSLLWVAGAGRQPATAE